MNQKRILRISVILMLGCMLFVLTGCGNDDVKKLNNQLNEVDNFYLNGGGSNKQNNDEPNSQSEPKADEPKNSQLVGVWQSPEMEDVKNENGQMVGYTVRNFYIFNSDGTWDNTTGRAGYTDEYSIIYKQLDSYINSNKSNKKYEFDGKKLVLKDEYGDTEHEYNITFADGGFYIGKDSKFVYTKYR